ncbi:hypothetical protein MUCCIDRAFT_105056 [Mucor lusitanicus CBS 277.49]|uniref:Uncharacterized protein n=1 Tax=Mucor lusitanicus CBS 277.49 TaxID=747725 RepID=A0A168PRC0_MUCCL|nr:hypothetical protein MUCCIDRAFT_105056 [Mucor lusitanicus CBS 277.49]
MPKKNNANKDMTQKVDKNRPKSKQAKKEEQKKHKMMKNEKVAMAKKGFETGNVNSKSS